MKKFYLGIILIMFVISSSSLPVLAKTMSYEEADITFEIKDDTVVLTKETPTYDEGWIKANVTNIKDKLKEFEDKEITATFYDPTSKISINYMMKHNATTIEQFDLMSKSEKEIDEYLDYLKNSTYESIMSIPNFDAYETGVDNRKVEIFIEKYPHKQTPFYRMTVSIIDGSKIAKEVIYGTLINGNSIYFDIYSESDKEIDETLVKYIVDSCNFTKILTLDEYNTMLDQAIVRLAIIASVIVIAIVLLVIILKRNRKINKIRTKYIATCMREFRERMRNNEVDKTIVYVNETTYDGDVTNAFSIYHIWLRDLIKYAIGAFFVAATLIYLINVESYIYAIIIAVLTVAYGYLKSVGVEKMKKNLDTRYNTKSKKVATIRFYNEYLTVTGLDSLSEYCYKQITQVKTYKDYIFLYTGSEQAIYVNKNGFTDVDAAKVIEFLKGRIFLSESAK